MLQQVHVAAANKVDMHVLYSASLSEITISETVTHGTIAITQLAHLAMLLIILLCTLELQTSSLGISFTWTRMSLTVC